MTLKEHFNQVKNDLNILNTAKSWNAASQNLLLEDGVDLTEGYARRMNLIHDTINDYVFNHQYEIIQMAAKELQKELNELEVSINYES